MKILFKILIHEKSLKNNRSNTSLATIGNYFSTQPKTIFDSLAYLRTADNPPLGQVNSYAKPATRKAWTPAMPNSRRPSLSTLLTHWTSCR